MDFKNWFLLISIFAVIGLFGFNLYNAPFQEMQQSDQTGEDSEGDVMSEDYVKPTDWETFEGETISFYYPEDWEPESREPFGGAIIEDVSLNIPESTENFVFYSVTPYDTIIPEDISKESKMELNNKEWTEWIREGENYVSYDFFTKDVGELASGAGSFGVHVMLKEKDDSLEKKLIDFIKTIKFEKEALENELQPVTPTVDPISL